MVGHLHRDDIPASISNFIQGEQVTVAADNASIRSCYYLCIAFCAGATRIGIDMFTYFQFILGVFLHPC
jgi:hypothetical protein